jgi:hypothetical protein
MKNAIISYTIGTQYDTYVAFGEHDGITDQEKRLFDELEQSSRIDAPKGFSFAHWSVQTDNYDEFAKCEATGLMGACCQFDAVYFEDEEPEDDDHDYGDYHPYGDPQI